MLRGRDSAANATDYARIRGVILDPINGSEDGQAIISAIVAGAEADVLKIGPGIEVGAPSGGNQGVGTINADNGIYKDGVLISSGIVQRVVVTSTAIDSTAALIPSDNTISQNTEGKLVFSQAFTPRSASSTILVEAMLQLSHGATGVNLVAAIFVDSGANAVAVGCVGGLGTCITPCLVSYSVSSGSTTSRTYTVRYGGDSGTTFLNRFSSSPAYNSTLTTILTITEFL